MSIRQIKVLAIIIILVTIVTLLFRIDGGKETPVTLESTETTTITPAPEPVPLPVDSEDNLESMEPVSGVSAAMNTNMISDPGSVTYMYITDTANNNDGMYYCDSNNIAREPGTDAALVAMGTHFMMGEYYTVILSDELGNRQIKKVEEKQDIHTINDAGVYGEDGSVVELLVCEGFDPTAVGNSSVIDVYVTEIYN